MRTQYIRTTLISLLLTVLTAATAASGALCAQNIAVFPSDHTGTGAQISIPGYSYQSNFPFSYGVSRQMALYETWDLKIPTGKQITHVGFPRDENTPRNRIAPYRITYLGIKRTVS